MQIWTAHVRLVSPGMGLTIRWVLPSPIPSPFWIQSAPSLEYLPVPLSLPLHYAAQRTLAGWGRGWILPQPGWLPTWRKHALLHVCNCQEPAQGVCACLAAGLDKAAHCTTVQQCGECFAVCFLSLHALLPLKQNLVVSEKTVGLGKDAENFEY